LRSTIVLILGSGTRILRNRFVRRKNIFYKNKGAYRIFRISTASVYRYISMCKFTLGDAEHVSTINTQIAPLVPMTVAANYYAVSKRLRLHEYRASMPRTLFLILLLNIKIWSEGVGSFFKCIIINNQWTLTLYVYVYINYYTLLTTVKYRLVRLMMIVGGLKYYVANDQNANIANCINDYLKTKI